MERRESAPERSQLGGYRLLEEIGSGTVATVYRARGEAGEAAVKVLHPHLAHDTVVRRRFLREVALTRTLIHPAIVRVYDLLAWEDTVAFAMEYCPGGNLSGWRPADPGELVRLAESVAGALAVAHGEGIVHRDLKPQNLLRDAEGRVKVCDFGSAGVQGTVSLTTSSLFITAPQYVAPEVFAGHPPDPRTDLYALGAVLYEAATGRPHRSQAVDPYGEGAAPGHPCTLNPSLPPWLGELILRLLAPVERRVPDTGALLHALRSRDVPAAPALKSCLFCGYKMPLAAAVCLYCGEEELALDPAAGSQGFFLLLKKMSEEADTLQRVTDLLRAVSGQPEFQLDVMIGDARLYSRAEQKRKVKLPARVADGLSRHDGDRLKGIFDRLGVRTEVWPMERVRRYRRGPLVRVAPGAVRIPEAEGVSRFGARKLAGVEAEWMRLLFGEVLVAVYRLAAETASRDLGGAMRESILRLQEASEQLLQRLLKLHEFLAGVDPAGLYFEVQRLERRLGSLEGQPGEEQTEELVTRKVRALEALDRHAAAEREQAALLSRLQQLRGRLQELAGRIHLLPAGPKEQAREAGSEIAAILAELDRETDPGSIPSQ
jgi:hypothetical protein